MTNYAKISLAAVVSVDDEYQPADHRWGPEEAASTPAHVVKGTGVAPTTPSVITIPLSDYTTIDTFLVKNTGAAAMTVNYEATAGAAQQIVGAGMPLVLPDMVVGTDITINCAVGTTTFEYMLLVTT